MWRRGFGRGFGAGWAYGGGSYGTGSYGAGGPGGFFYGGYPGWGRGRGRGRGNPYGFCRNFPWLPRWWWATPHAGAYATTIPYQMGYGYSSYGAGYVQPYGYRGYGTGYAG